MTPHQAAAFNAPLVGRAGEQVQTWSDGPWQFGLSFNR